MRARRRCLGRCQFPRPWTLCELSFAALPRKLLRARDPRSSSRKLPSYTCGLSEDRSCICRSSNHGSPGIADNRFAEVENGRLVGGAAHAANRDCRNNPAEHVEFRAPHILIEKIVHVRMGHKSYECLFAGNLLDDGRGQGLASAVQDVDRPQWQWA